jgi:hypothetical protein
MRQRAILWHDNQPLASAHQKALEPKHPKGKGDGWVNPKETQRLYLLHQSWQSAKGHPLEASIAFRCLYIPIIWRPK